MNSLKTRDRLDRFTGNLDWNLLKHFIQIGKTGSISAAAVALRLKQPSVSVALKHLECELGGTLCRRTARGVDLTPAGQQLLELCLQMERLIRAMPDAVEGYGALQPTSINVQTISDVTSAPLDDALTQFHADYPDIELRFQTVDPPTVQTALRADAAEVGIGFDGDPQPDLSYLLLVQEMQQLYCGPRHPLYGVKITDPVVLKNEAFIGLGHSEPAELIRYRHRFGLGRNLAAVASSVREAMWLLELGVGIGFAPQPVVDRSNAASLWPLLTDALAPKCNIYLMWRTDMPPTKPAQAFIDSVARHVPPVIAAH